MQYVQLGIPSHRRLVMGVTLLAVVVCAALWGATNLQAELARSQWETFDRAGVEFEIRTWTYYEDHTDEEVTLGNVYLQLEVVEGCADGKRAIVYSGDPAQTPSTSLGEWLSPSICDPDDETILWDIFDDTTFDHSVNGADGTIVHNVVVSGSLVNGLAFGWATLFYTDPEEIDYDCIGC